MTPVPALACNQTAGKKIRPSIELVPGSQCRLKTKTAETSTVLVSAVFVFSLHWLPGTSSMLDGFSYRQLVMPVLVLVLST